MGKRSYLYLQGAYRVGTERHVSHYNTEQQEAKNGNARGALRKRQKGKHIESKINKNRI